jgi:hypothetical protein
MFHKKYIKYKLKYLNEKKLYILRGGMDGVDSNMLILDTGNQTALGQDDTGKTAVALDDTGKTAVAIDSAGNIGNFVATNPNTGFFIQSKCKNFNMSTVYTLPIGSDIGGIIIKNENKLIDNYYIINELNLISKKYLLEDKKLADNELSIYNIINANISKFNNHEKSADLFYYFASEHFDKYIYLQFCNNDNIHSNATLKIFNNESIIPFLNENDDSKIFYDLGQLFHFLIFTCNITLIHINILFCNNKIYIINFENSILDNSSEYQQIFDLSKLNDKHKEQFKTGFNKNELLKKLFNI